MESLMFKKLTVFALVLFFAMSVWAVNRGDVKAPADQQQSIEKNMPQEVYIAPDGQIKKDLPSPYNELGIKPNREFKDAQPLKKPLPYLDEPQLDAFESYIEYAMRPYDAGFIFSGTDSVGQWFRPVTQCSLLAIRIDFNTDAVGRTYNVEVHRINPEHDGVYDFSAGTESGASPGGFPQDWTGRLMGSYEHTVSQAGYIELPVSVFGISEEDQNLGLHDFQVKWWFDPAETGQDEAQLYGDLPAPFNHHGIKYYAEGQGGDPTPRWVPRYNFSIDAKVLYYGDPPPTISGDNEIPDQYNSLNPGPYTAEATVNDLGTDVFEGYVRKVAIIMDNDDDPFNGPNDTTYVYEDEAGGDEMSEVTVSYDIANPGVGNSVYYWWYAEDNGAENTDDPAAQTHTATSGKHHFTVREKNPNATILLVDDSGDQGFRENITSTLNALGYIHDVWSTADGDSMTFEVLDLYETVIWFNGVATGGWLAGGLDDTVVPRFLDQGGKNFFFSSSDYVGIVEDDFSDNFKAPGDDTPTEDFVTDYLKIALFRDDANLGDGSGPRGSYSQDTLYRGVAGTFMEGIGEFESDPFDFGLANWNGEAYASDGMDVLNVWDASVGDWNPAAGIYYEGDYKLLFLPWTFEHIHSGEVRADFISRLMAPDQFDVNAAPIFANLDGSRYKVSGTGPFPVSVDVEDSDGSVESVELGYTVDNTGEWTWMAMSAAEGNTFTANLPALSDQDTMYTYTVRATDDAGSTRYFDGDPYYLERSSFTPQNSILYVGENPYDWWHGDNVDSIMTATMDKFDAEYDVWDADAMGMMDAKTILDEYDAVIYSGYSDWVNIMPRKTAENPFTEYIENGNYFVYTSEEILGLWEDWGDGELLAPGDFGYDVMGVTSVFHDFGYFRMYPFNASFVNAGIDSMEMDTLLNLTNYSDYMTFADGYTVPFLGYDGANNFYAGTQNPEGNMVFLGFHIARLEESARDQVMENILNEVTSIEDEAIADNKLPNKFSLKQNYPNPFNPVTNIEFALPKATDVTITIYNVLGKKVRTLYNGQMNAGSHKLVWNGLNENGSQVSSGIYIYKMEAADFNATKKMVLMK